MVRFLSMERLKNEFTSRIQNPESQRTMVLCVVCIALLLDNMLYMVIVPIIPDYLQTIWSLGQEEVVWTNGTHSQQMSLKNNEFNVTTGQYQLRWLVHESDAKIGTLFAFKAIIQLLFNPISGTIIDRIGYDVPMMFGLCVIFVSTSMFAFGYSFGLMFLARGLQGMGSAFADTAGLAMIADRYTSEQERTKALGIALAFISFGSLVAPPFGGILYQFFGKEIPFLSLAFIALIDGFLLMVIMQPIRIERTVLKAEGNLPKGTPIHRLLQDPYIAICAGCLAVANVSLAFLEPTISNWMSQTMKATNAQEGLVWLPAFLPHLAGVVTTVKLAVKYPKHQWLMAAVGLAIEGISCFFIPFSSNFIALMIPISVLCYGIALVDTAILPTMAFLVDTRHVSVYGSVYAIADISYSLAYAIGPIVAGGLVQAINFYGLNIVITLLTLVYVPVLYLLRNCCKECEITAASRELRRRSTFSVSGRKFAQESLNEAALLDSEDKLIYPGYDPSSSVGTSDKNSRTLNTQVCHGKYDSTADEFSIVKQDGYGYG
ncbi:MFS transporter, DHA1 family, solute carrier family 18, member 3 [Paragonimus westermani]|uniref:MFS transporter, DHA1 family, solute carrier family 18, member 3 n=1 Tax=Paragonimus westermani TaxID=34504 RepID=A0A5J4NLF2_9TREM|nr:MFS transporter, DHA1 family, solute carrier family 18, member 3 [Paragonimus westermani]